jgi:thiamine-monophosphate kinase
MTETSEGSKIITKAGNTFDITAQGWNAFAQQ